MANEIIVGHYEKVRALAHNGRRLAVSGTRAGTASKIVLWDLVTQKPWREFTMPAHILGLAFAGDLLIGAGTDGGIHLLHGGEGEGPAPRGFLLARTGGTCHAVAVAPNGRNAALVGSTGSVWSVALDPITVTEIPLSSAPLHAVAIDPSGEYLAAAGDDGVVRVITFADLEIREMPGHEGAVRALCFTRDGRLCSAGDDGTIRIWYLAGAVEHEKRGGDSGHTGAITALAFAPPSPNEDDDRLYSAGDDGKIKVWRLSDRRKPKTLDCGETPLRALVFTPASQDEQKNGSPSALIAGGDARALSRFPIDAAGAPAADKPVALLDSFTVLRINTNGPRPAREEVIRLLAPMAEPEALELVSGLLANDKDPEVRAQAANAFGLAGRRDARPFLRAQLDDATAKVRAAAFAALQEIDRDTPLSPLRAALASKFGDLRSAAIGGLVPLRQTSPLIPGLIADRLVDMDPEVRLAALAGLVAIHGENSLEPLRTAYERGPENVKIEVLCRATLAGLIGRPEIVPIVARALDDQDAGVRRMAFAVKVLSRPALAAVLDEPGEDLGRAVLEIAQRGAHLVRRMELGKTGADAAPSDAEIAAVRARIGGGVTSATRPGEADLEPLLTAMACRSPDTALRGARGLARLGDTRALGALLQLSRETSAALRAQAATALQALADPRAEKRLVWMLDDGDPAVRVAAFEAFTRMQAAGEPLAIAEVALRSSQEDIRVRGLDRLMKLEAGARTKHAETLLSDAIEDEADKVRHEAWNTLLSWNGPVDATYDRAAAARFPSVRSRMLTLLLEHKERAWARPRIMALIADRDAGVALAAYEGIVKLARAAATEAKSTEKEDPAPHLAALKSQHASVLTAGARGSVASAASPELRAALIGLFSNDDPNVRYAAVNALDVLYPNDASPLKSALHSAFLDLKVRAAELLAIRRDEDLLEPMRLLLSDKELPKRIPPDILAPLRRRAAWALASLGSPRSVKYLATELLKDDANEVREQAARGLSIACRREDEGYLLDALGHADAWVRSWAAEGLARLGDVRALPVMTGQLRHEHLPIRQGAIMAFAALGPEGYGGMLQGLEDPDRGVVEMVFTIVLARDLTAFRTGAPPDLLTSALSSQRAEIRYVAARALELRTDPEAYLAHLIEILTPPKPENAGDMKDWPTEEARARLAVGLADALAADDSETRYAAAQVLRLRTRPLEYFREMRRVAGLRSPDVTLVPDNAPRASDPKARPPWLRRLFSSSGATAVGAQDQARLHLLAFGAYVGLLRQIVAGDEEGPKVRRDVIDRIVELALAGHVSITSAIPPLLRALDDPHHLVRKAAFAGLRALHPNAPDEPLSMALSGAAPDVARAALDELAARGASARPRVAAALSSPLPDVRKYAFTLLEKLDPGSLEPLFVALASEHADLRLGVLERLAALQDERVDRALVRAMESDHDDLRLRAAELIVDRKDDRAIPVLAAFLRGDDKKLAARAAKALVALATPAAVAALVARLEEALEPERLELVGALKNTRSAAAIPGLIARFEDEAQGVRAAAFAACLEIARGLVIQPKVAKVPPRLHRDPVQAMRFLRAAALAKDPALRLSAASELDYDDDPAANDIATALFGDRDLAVRSAAVLSYSKRVIDKAAPVAPLEQVLKAGARELMLAAAEGVAARKLPSAFRPLLLFVRAGEAGERERALLALGTLGDARAVEEIETIFAGGTEEAPAEPSMQVAATEALGRMVPALSDEETRRRVRDKVENTVAFGSTTELQQAAVRGLRAIGDERARVKLESVLVDPETHVNVRVVAATELGKIGSAASEPALALALDDAQTALRLEARKALELIFASDRARVEFLATGSKYDDISKPAATFLANEGDPRTIVPRLALPLDVALHRRLRFGLIQRQALPVPELAQLTTSDDPIAREDAAWIIGALAGKIVLADGDRAMLGSALVAATARTAQRFAQHQHGAKDRLAAETRAWAHLIWAAAELRAAGIVDVARGLLGAETPASVRRAAVRAVGRLGGVQDAAPLATALADDDADVRNAAAAALAAVAPAAAALVAVKVTPFDPTPLAVVARDPANRDSLLDVEPGRRIALPVTIAERASPRLIGLAERTADDDTLKDALAALSRIATPDAIAYLRSVANDAEADDELRKQARLAMRRAVRRAAASAKQEGLRP